MEFVGFPRSIEQVLGSWRGLFVGRKRKDVRRARPLCLFWTHWNARNKVFEDKVLSIQKLKTSLIKFLCAEAKLCIKEGPKTLVEFIEWLCSK